MRSFIQDQIHTNQIEYLDDFLNEECISFFTLEELEQIFEMIAIDKQSLLRKVNGLINKKRVIEKLKRRKSIKIAEDRIWSSHSDF